MTAPRRPDRPCYSMRLVMPFLRALSGYEKLAPGLSTLEAKDPDERIPIETVHQMLEGAVEVTGDPDLGLKAAQNTELGDAGAADYLVSTVDTVADAIEVLVRYRRLLNDGLEIDCRVENDSAVVVLENTVVLPRAAADFQIGAVFNVHFRHWMGQDVPHCRVMLKHAAPPDTTEYERLFGRIPVAFRAPFSGFVFPKSRLDARLERADSSLHGVIKKHAEHVLAQLGPTRSMTQEVEARIVKELAAGNPSAANIAAQLGMSSRTLGRQLSREGTTFTEVLDDLRRRLALEYVGNRDLSLADVGLLLGFSQVSAFHRAFRRWTGATPLQYRRDRLRAGVGAVNRRAP